METVHAPPKHRTSERQQGNITHGHLSSKTHQQTQKTSGCSGSLVLQGSPACSSRSKDPPAAGKPVHSGDTARRDIHPQDVLWANPKYCIGCRGQHDAGHEHDPAWQPYTPRQRLANLQQLTSRFQVALRHGDLPVQLSDSAMSPVRWLAPGGPKAMDCKAFGQCLALLCEGARESHEPHRFLAVQALAEMMAAGSLHMVAAAPACVGPLRLGLNTLEPSLAGTCMLLLQRLLRSHQGVGAALVPHYSQLASAMCVFRSRQLLLWLPPPHCVPPTGAFDGSAARDGPSCCPTCGALLSRVDLPRAPLAGARQQAAQQHVQHQDHLPRRPSTAPARHSELVRQDLQVNRLSKPIVHQRVIGSSIEAARYVLAELVTATLDCMAQHSGAKGLAAIKRVIPTYDYYDPKD